MIRICFGQHLKHKAMFNLRRKIQFMTFLTLVLAWPYAPVTAQTVKGLDNNSSGTSQPTLSMGEGKSEFLIDPEAQIKGENIKQHTYRSDPAGQNKNWNLDIGRFQDEYKDDPNRISDKLDNDSFSGMRLRLPFRGRTGR